MGGRAGGWVGAGCVAHTTAELQTPAAEGRLGGGWSVPGPVRSQREADSCPALGRMYSTVHTQPQRAEPPAGLTCVANPPRCRSPRSCACACARGGSAGRGGAGGGGRWRLRGGGPRGARRRRRCWQAPPPPAAASSDATTPHLQAHLAAAAVVSELGHGVQPRTLHTGEGEATSMLGTDAAGSASCRCRRTPPYEASPPRTRTSFLEGGGRNAGFKRPLYRSLNPSKRPLESRIPATTPSRRLVSLRLVEAPNNRLTLMRPNR